jgi:hypothetical protein
MRKLPAVLTFQPLTVATHMVARAAREAGAWLSVLLLAAFLAAAMTLALTSARQEAEPLRATTDIESGSPADARLCARKVASEATVSTGLDLDGPYVPNGIPDGADAWSAGKIRLDQLDINDSSGCVSYSWS